ncbi:hypothetical protein [Nocardioides dilutus]
MPRSHPPGDHRAYDPPFGKERYATIRTHSRQCVNRSWGIPSDRPLSGSGQESRSLRPKTWYGFPSYARDGKVVVFFKPASKFKTRYATLGFEEAAQLDDGAMWVTSYAVVEIGRAEEKPRAGHQGSGLARREIPAIRSGRADAVSLW